MEAGKIQYLYKSGYTLRCVKKLNKAKLYLMLHFHCYVTILANSIKLNVAGGLQIYDLCFLQNEIT